LEEVAGGFVGERQVAEFIQLCGYPHSWIYAATATMPKLSCVSVR
jgi:hypothetical protein